MRNRKKSVVSTGVADNLGSDHGRLRDMNWITGWPLSWDVGHEGHFCSGSGDDFDGDFGFGGFLEGG